MKLLIPERRSPIINKSISTGDKFMSDVLKGGQKVQPVVVLNSVHKDINK